MWKLARFCKEYLYAQKKNTNASNYDFNLIGQGTSLLTLTTGMYDGSSADAYFVNIYATINSVSNSGTPPRYTAKIDLVGHLNDFRAQRYKNI